jgi:hypothetical protein
MRDFGDYVLTSGAFPKVLSQAIIAYLSVHPIDLQRFATTFAIVWNGPGRTLNIAIFRQN